jgi:hypothetical protein
VSSPIDPSRSYELGSRLAGYLPPTVPANPQALLGLLSDLVGDEQALLAPLRHLVGMPGFSDLLKRVGTGTGLHERDALLQTISQTYNSAVVVALSHFLDGLLALPEHLAAPSQSKLIATAQPQSSGPAASDSSNPYPSQTSYNPTAFEKDRQPRRSFISLLVLGVVTVLLTATAAVSLRSGALCSLGIACPPGSSLGVLQGVDAAAKAAQKMETATSLAAYSQALTTLEGQLAALKVMDSSAFTGEQIQRLARLQSLATEGRSRLAAEQLDQERIEQLTTEVDALSHLEPGQELQSRLAQAASSLGSINPRSFASAKAKELQTRLDGFQVDPAPQSSDNSGIDGTSTPVTEPAPNQREVRPASPRGAPQPAPRTSGGSSWRSEP